MAVPREFVRRLIEAADIAQIVGERVALKKRGSNLSGLCPFHSEKTPSFSVNPSKGVYHCFGCGQSGNTLSFVIHTEGGGDFMTGVEALARRLGMPIPRGDNDPGEQLANAAAAAANYFQRQLASSESTKAYVEKRGLSGETVARFGIGYAPKKGIVNALRDYDQPLLQKAGLLGRDDSGEFYDYFRDRLMFPIMEGQRRVLGFGGRALSDNVRAKYLNSPETALFSKKNTVFGLPQAREEARRKNRLIVVEGYMDTVMLSQAGFGETAAAMGTALTAAQMRRIGRTADNIILAFDGDDAGQKAARRSLENILPGLADGMSARFLFLPPGEDPDSFIRANGAAAFEKLIAEAPPLADYMIEKLWQESESSPGDLEAKIGAALTKGNQLIHLLDGRRAPILHELLRKRLADKAGLAPDAMDKVVRQMAAKNSPKSTNKARYRMRDNGELYQFLCCLAAQPGLVLELRDNPPLLGNQQECEIVADVLHYLTWDPDEDGDALSYLADEGWTSLVAQIKATICQRYGATIDLKAELKERTAALVRAHARLTGADKKKWLAVIRQNTSD